jgi:hypothetical protein
MTKVNNVIGVINYVIAARPSLLNFMTADICTADCSRRQRTHIRDQRAIASASRCPGMRLP